MNTHKPIAEFEFGNDDEWLDFLAEIDSQMQGASHWRVDGENIDWQHRNGTKYTAADTARALLRAIYSEDVFRLYRGGQRGQFVVNAPTHDTPTGSFYTFTPIASSTFQRYI